MKYLKVVFFAFSLLGMQVRAQGQAPPEYSPNNADASSEIVQSWRDEAKPFETIKRKLIASGKIVIDRAPPRASLPPPVLAKNFKVMDFNDSACRARIIARDPFADEPKVKDSFKLAPETDSDPAGHCWTKKINSSAHDVYGLAASVTSQKALIYMQPVMHLYTKGYAANEHFNFVEIHINDHQSFEEAVLKSGNLSADEQGLYMNRLLSPMGHNSLPIDLPLVQKNNQGTQMIVARSVSRMALNKKDPNPYGVCIYSLHGNVNRSAEALTCFYDAAPKTYTNKYIEQYLKVLDSIRLAP